MFDLRRIGLAKRFPIGSPLPPLRPPAIGVWFTEAKAGQCRWPLWVYGEPIDKKIICGRRTDGTYCREHAEVAYRRDV